MKPASNISSQTSSASSRETRLGPLVPAACAVGMFVGTLWAYWPALLETFEAWNRDPDYSHGYLVAPLAVAFLWLRRDRLDFDRIAPEWLGLILLMIVLAGRVFSARYFLGPIDNWTFPLTIAGVVWVCFGRHCLLWALPSIVFVYFMFPIPYSAETWLSLPLQRLATKLSVETLQLLGQPAIAEGNVIWLGRDPLFVAEACSGLRILVGVFALAFAYLLFSNWSGWQKLLVLVAAVPVALVANVFRIVLTGLLMHHVSDQAAERFSHDLAGFLMIPLAAGLFWLFLVYLELLFPRVETLSPSVVLAASRSQPVAQR